VITLITSCCFDGWKSSRAWMVTVIEAVLVILVAADD
jgi:hypothetical protein